MAEINDSAPLGYYDKSKDEFVVLHPERICVVNIDKSNVKDSTALTFSTHDTTTDECAEMTDEKWKKLLDHYKK